MDAPEMEKPSILIKNLQKEDDGNLKKAKKNASAFLQTFFGKKEEKGWE